MNMGAYGKVCMPLVNGNFRTITYSITGNREERNGGRKRFNGNVIEI